MGADILPETLRFGVLFGTGNKGLLVKVSQNEFRRCRHLSPRCCTVPQCNFEKNIQNKTAAMEWFPYAKRRVM